VVVATDYYWTPIDKYTPIGAKLQLLTKGGVAIYSNYSPKDNFSTHWAPLPKRPPNSIPLHLSHLDMAVLANKAKHSPRRMKPLDQPSVQAQ
jgi:hypothetical protein